MDTGLACNKGMTTREISNALNVSVDTVQKAVKELQSTSDFFRKFKRGQTPRFSEAEVTAIKTKLQNRSKVNALTPKTRLEKQLIIQQAMRLQEEIIAELQAENLQIATERDGLRIELDKSKEWASVKRMEALNDAAYSWKALKRYSLENGYEIKKVFDQNYGNVNAYHKDVWEAVYGEQVDNVPWE